MLLSTKSNFCSGEKQTERKIKGREIKDVIGERLSFGSLLVLSQINTGSNRCGIDLPFAAAGMVEKKRHSILVGPTHYEDDEAQPRKSYMYAQRKRLHDCYEYFNCDIYR